MAFEKKVSIAIIGKTDQFVKSLTKGQKALQGLGSAASKIGKAAAFGIAGIGVAAVTVGKDLVNLASDAGEARSAFETTFGDALPQVSGFVEEFANKAGLAAFELEGLLTNTGAVLQGIDFTAEASGDLGTKLASLAGDVASFANVQGGAQPVLEAFTKSLLGENESLKTYGIAISQAEVETKAFEMTGKTSRDELTKQERALATYELLLKKTTVQQGDLNRTQDSFANKSRKAQAQVKELKVQLGEELLPIAEQLLPVIVDMVQELGPSLIQAIKGVAPFLASVAELFGLLAPPIIAIITLLLQALAPAFKKFTEIVNKFVAPFLVNLPKNFEKMINRIIGGFNRFADKLNSFAEKAQRILGKIGIKIDIPKLRKFSEVDFGLSEKELAPIVSADDIDAQRTATGLLATAKSSAIAATATPTGLTVNFNGTVTNPQEAKDVVVQGLKEFNRTEGALNRVITIE
jgi:phage-related protein